ncbi:DUF4252 domain-containing protein [Polaribacter tangerinus]|uniref:DUF4252 domain-containing protein n=1 Tax=Polaribacter tangerinus TaxID=1920034 RepID=UPI000B4B654D|nr:DUF4252 domain-containing protein [Polaribacter tangerinus]
MKKIILLMAFLVAPLLSNAQQSVFDSLEDMDGVDMVVVTKDMFQILSKFSPEKLSKSKEMQVFKMISELQQFRMFSSEDKQIASNMEKMANTLIKQQKLTELMRIKEDDSRVKIYVKTTNTKDYVSEVLMFIKGIDKRTKGFSEAMVVSLSGNIDINMISKLADTLTKE